jgi:hypothetical protein
MAKTEVYSWRLSAERKRALETRARTEGKTLAQVLDQLAQEWLARPLDEDDEAEQRRIHAAAAKAIGAIAGNNPRLSESVETEMYRRLKRQYGR